MRNAVDELESELARLFSALHDGEPQTPVPSCPGWTFTELTSHVRGTHRWVEQMVRTGERARFSEVHEDVSPEQLVATLRAADPNAAMWTLGRDQHVRFWQRRMVHEAVLHRVDAEFSLGCESVIDAAVAADGIDELLENLTTFPWLSKGLVEFQHWGESIHLHATDGEGEWLINFVEPGFEWTHGHQKATVAALGSTADLLLLMYGRRRPDDPRLKVFGPFELLTTWQAKAKF